MKWIVHPLLDVNGIEYGWSRKQVRDKMAESLTSFSDTDSDSSQVDDYGYCLMYFDHLDRLEAVEIFDRINIVVNNNVIFPGNISVVKKVFPDLQEECGHYYSDKYSVGISVDGTSITSILFGKADYY